MTASVRFLTGAFVLAAIAGCGAANDTVLTSQNTVSQDGSGQGFIEQTPVASIGTAESATSPAPAPVPAPALPTPKKRAAGTRTVAIYQGKAACKGCSESVAKMLAKDKGTSWKVKYVGDGTDKPLVAGSLDGVDLYVQPGGGADVNVAWQEIGESAQTTVRNYVQNGGSYLGICMGAYMVGRFNEAGWGWVRNIRPANLSEQVTSILWKGKQRFVYVEDPPKFGPKGTQPTELAHYQSGEVAAARVSAGKGRVVVVGPHPEANEWWYDPVKQGDVDGLDADIGIDLAHQAVD